MRKVKKKMNRHRYTIKGLWQLWKGIPREDRPVLLEAIRKIAEEPEAGEPVKALALGTDRCPLCGGQLQFRLGSGDAVLFVYCDNCDEDYVTPAQ